MWECGNGDVEGESQIVFSMNSTNTYKKPVKDMFFRMNISVTFVPAGLAHDHKTREES